MVNAIGIARAIRRGQSIQCCAVIVAEHGRIGRNILFSTWYAKAQYNMESKQVAGVMLSPVKVKRLKYS